VTLSGIGSGKHYLGYVRQLALQDCENFDGLILRYVFTKSDRPPPNLALQGVIVTLTLILISPFEFATIFCWIFGGPRPSEDVLVNGQTSCVNFYRLRPCATFSQPSFGLVRMIL
jgi:hypothetical protein